MGKGIGLFKVYFKDASGALRVDIVNDVNEIKAPNEIIKVEKTRPERCFKCC